MGYEIKLRARTGMRQTLAISVLGTVICSLRLCSKQRGHTFLGVVLESFPSCSPMPKERSVGCSPKELPLAFSHPLASLAILEA